MKRWVPPPSPHPTVPEHGPGVGPVFLICWPLPVQTAQAFGRSEPLDWKLTRIPASRN